MRFKLRFTIVNHLLRMFLLVLILLMTMIFALLWFFQIDVTARGRGSVTCGNWIDIKPEIEGIIEKMAVREGEWVREGKLLFSLEERERKLEVDATELKIAEMRITVAKLRSQLFLTQEKIAAAIDEARAALVAAQANYRISLKGPKPEEVILARRKILRAVRCLEKARKDYKRMEKAYSLKVVPRIEFEQALHQKRLSEVDVTLARDELKLLRNKYDADQIAAARAEVDRCEAVLARTIARRNELDMLRRGIESTLKALAREERQLAVLKEHLNLTHVRAPMDGYILTHDPEHLVGKAVAEGEVVLRLGDSRQYTIDCNVPERDFPLVEVGQEARVQIKPFPKGEYKLFKGVVIQVGADVNETRPPAEKRTGEKVPGLLGNQVPAEEGSFPVVLSLAEPYTMEIFGDVYEIKPGFSAEVEIITRRERLANFLLRRVLRIKGKLIPDRIHL
ncbi:MAG: HlyD family efflux transporter periplasmic adaptor subunit [Deltaproteobacteria bacterium]|nr:HlyD family efflux transporter periplasmic adaptor subunit [Deltaproteobacteria bacterium]MBW2122550.1 HlyD family efflux transporter periplasmic adaptor subunit [Deltaproteobacteria bacterium]